MAMVRACLIILGLLMAWGAVRAEPARVLGLLHGAVAAVS